MEKWILFGAISALIILVSWRNLLKIKSHGFYRLFSWIGMAWLISNNYPFWFSNPFSLHQLFSWGLLLIALYLVMTGGILLIRKGKPSANREDETLFAFEKTTGLIDTGVYKYIRHPLYSSLIYLTWGIFFKNPNYPLLIVAIFSSVMLYLTAKLDENECIIYFKEDYINYMKRSKMFVPFLF